MVGIVKHGAGFPFNRLTKHLMKEIPRVDSAAPLSAIQNVVLAQAVQVAPRLILQVAPRLISEQLLLQVATRLISEQLFAPVADNRICRYTAKSCLAAPT